MHFGTLLSGLYQEQAIEEAQQITPKSKKTETHIILDIISSLRFKRLLRRLAPRNDTRLAYHNDTSLVYHNDTYFTATMRAIKS